MNYYNENDGHAANWIEALIGMGLVAPGHVDRRSVADVGASDLRGYTQCHFFAGIGGWPHALRLAGWPDRQPVWTGSCPCQPVSSAARGRNRRTACDRHLWPVWRKLIAAARPGVVFGEQVAQAADWHAEVGDDLELDGYAFGTAYLPACSVGLDHARSRLFFVGNANGQGQSIGALDAEVARLQRDRCEPRGLVPPYELPDRMALLRGFGNAIVAELAAEFIQASVEALLRTTSNGD